jgi:hypothetical protein
LSIVEVHQLDQGFFSSVTRPDTQLDDTGISTGTIGHHRCNLIKQPGGSLLVPQMTEHMAAVVRAVFLGSGNDRFNKLLSALALANVVTIRSLFIRATESAIIVAFLCEAVRPSFRPFTK